MNTTQKLINEHEDIAALLHRWANLRGVHGAYKAFLNEEILVGEDRVCSDIADVKQVASSLLTVYYSYLYSMFDKPKASTNFLESTKKILPDLDSKATEIWNYINGLWSAIESEMMQLRHKIGFHGERTFDGMTHGYKQFHKINPLIPEQILLWMTVFFRYVDLAYSLSEAHLHSLDGKAVDGFFAYALDQQEKLAIFLFANTQEFMDSMTEEFLVNGGDIDDFKQAVRDKFYSLINFDPRSAAHVVKD
ncbi:hypothetical protein F3J45_06735 [Pantoea sp. Ap-967]|uniref:hypothetical protein n=1 Tax=Pantoea sp. Ap-967 TaxID=2608362 RepID=UPI00141F72F1|nr:hypothetical protein [Pantoea sp. Ap-967]NIE74137.1 hypothetical protein [Pantoea sp. Ap-967]